MLEYSISQDIASGTFNSDKLQSEIINANCVTDLKGITSVGDKIIISCAVILDQDVLNAVIHDHVAVTLDDNKTAKKKLIDARTQAIIRSGFYFDGHHFSLSPNAQLNWIGMVVMQGGLPWPLELTTDDDSAYNLEFASLPAFVGSGMTIVNMQLMAGRALKEACNNASTQEELDAVVDTR